MTRVLPSEDGSGPDAPPTHQEVFDASPFGTLIMTPELVLLDCNAEHSSKSGVPAEAIRGRYMFDLWPKNPDQPGPDTETTIRTSVAQVMRTGAPDETPIQKHDMPRPEGGFEPRYWRIIHSPIFRNGRIIAIRQDSWDVTAAMLERERQETLQRVAGTLAGMAFYEVDIAADQVRHSPEFDTLFGFPADAGLDVPRPFSTYAARFHDDDRAMIDTAIGGLMREGPGAVRQFEYRIVRPDGEIRTALVRGETTLGADGRLTITGITFDTTELRHREACLSALLEQKEALLGEINHRVKNSLQLVGAILRLEARFSAPLEGARLRSAAARVQAVAAVHSSLYQGEDMDSIEMGAHLRAFCAHLGETLGAKTRGIALSVDADTVALPISKAVPLSIIVNELVTNAFKHGFDTEAPAGSQVDVVLRRGAGDTVILCISNTGRPGGTADAPHASNSHEDVSGSAVARGHIGSRLIATLGRQIGARVTEKHDDGWQTCVEFTV